MGSWSRWTKEEEEFVKDNHKTMTDVEMGKSLNRPPGGVANKRGHMGIKRQVIRGEYNKRFKQVFREGSFTVVRCPNCGGKAHRGELKLICYTCNLDVFMNTVEYEKTLEHGLCDRKVKCKSRGTNRLYMALKIHSGRSPWCVFMDKSDVEFSFEHFIDVFIIEEQDLKSWKEMKTTIWV